MNTTRHTPMQNRSRERVDAILAAASQLLSAGGVDALSTRALAEHARIPVGTIYRYFANRDAIIAAYLERDLERIEESIVTELLATRTVTCRSMTAAFAEGHLNYHRAHPASVRVWFEGRFNPAVSGAVQQLDHRHAQALSAATASTGMIEAQPWFVSELLVRLFDRTFEFIYASGCSAAQQERILGTAVDLVAGWLERFAAEPGREGVPAEDFVLAFSSYGRPAREGPDNRT